MKKIIKTIVLVILIVLFVITGVFIYNHETTKYGIPIIGYHGVVEDVEKEANYKDNHYFLSKSMFQRQMQYLYDHGYQTLTLDQVYDYYQGNMDVGEKVVVLTFDDGYKNFNTIVKPILEQYQFQGTCFVIGKHLNDSSNSFLKTEDILNTKYVQYYSHSYNLHQKADGFDKKIIETLSLEEIDQDFDDSKVDHTYFAFPYGRTRDDINPILEKHQVKMAFSYNQIRHLTRNDDIYKLPRYLMLDIMPDFYFHWIVE